MASDDQKKNRSRSAEDVQKAAENHGPEKIDLKESEVKEGKEAEVEVVVESREDAAVVVQTVLGEAEAAVVVDPKTPQKLPPPVSQ